MAVEAIKKTDTADFTPKSAKVDSAAAFVPLEDLTEDELQRLLKSSKLGVLVDVFSKNQINGFILTTVCKEDLVSIGMNVLHITSLMRCIDDWNKNGVSAALIGR